MKLISLNTWGGKYFAPFINFIKQHAEDTDIFCFQEVFNTNSSFKQFPLYRANLLEEISNILPNSDHFFDPVLKGLDIEANPVNFDLEHGLATFARKTIAMDNYQAYFIYKDKVSSLTKKDFSDIPVNMQCLNFRKDSKEFTVCNFHGASYPGSKLDSPQRIEQSKKVKEIIDSKIGAKILVGDFNLLPSTQSIKIFEENMRNLIKEFEISRTRSNLSPFFGKPNFLKFADYTFVSPDIRVIDFKVPDVEVSDHLPMVLEFS